MAAEEREKLLGVAKLQRTKEAGEVISSSLGGDTDREGGLRTYKWEEDEALIVDRSHGLEIAHFHHL